MNKYQPIWDSLRPSVQYFAVEMERELKRHDDKGGWTKDNCTVSYLEDRLIQELGEFFKKHGIDELVDIANFCMMIYTRNGGLPEKYQR